MSTSMSKNPSIASIFSPVTLPRQRSGVMRWNGMTCQREMKQCRNQMPYSRFKSMDIKNSYFVVTVSPELGYEQVEV
jgi:hypothetical protein